MRTVPSILAVFLLFSPAVALSQINSSPKRSVGLEVLKRVEQRYADAKTYSIAATQEMRQIGKYFRIWDKTVLAAAEAPGGRYRFEGHGNLGGAIRMSDGKTVWTYHTDEHRYTARSVSAANPKAAGMLLPSEAAVHNAKNLRYPLAHLTFSTRSATLLPDETVLIEGKPVRCLVVRIRNSDEERPDRNEQFEKTIWIDAKRQTVVKIETRRGVKLVPRGLPFTQTTTITYTRTVLGEGYSDAKFTFTPPAGATLLASFPDPVDGPFTMTGDTIPALQLKAADGKTVPIESFRGKPVLIDFWATWCAPCVAEMPKLAEIYKEGKEKGLVMISIDKDEQAAQANAFLAKHGYDWPNFHDGDGAIGKLMGDSALPRTVLVDAKGQIVYDRMGEDDNRLRTHLAALGPEFHDLGPRAPQPVPCIVGK